MTFSHLKATRSMLVCGAAAAALITATPAFAEDQVASIDIPAQPMAAALKDLAKQSGANILFSPDAVRGLTAPAVQTSATPQEAARILLAGTDLAVTRDATGALIVRAAQDPQGGSAAGGGATVEALIVTAQKREEDIQDVPIAISAFSAEKLDQMKIEGGFDLLKAIPNVTFSKNNFTSYNFSIRGVGTKAVSATTDPGVAVAFNNTTLIQNRLFEQEYFDVERVEVLRGPQGTLYGRNATSGVINVISAKPDLNEFDGWLKGEVGNYDTKRVSAMVNVPLIEDKLAIRLAGALTSREGYDYNSVTKNAVNGRELWSARLTIGFEPTERLRGEFIWERFEEDDNRSRTGKQLCHRDPGKQMIGSTPVVVYPDNHYQATIRPALFSQGCQPGSLYEDAAFGTPNGLALPFVFSLLALGTECSGGGAPNCSALFNIGRDRDGKQATILQLEDPYGGMMQSRDLRTIASFRDPVYQARADLLELNINYSVGDFLEVISQTAYVEDSVYSFQDFNRFNTEPIFTDTSQLTHRFGGSAPSEWRDVAPGGVFCDPQLGCSDTLAGFDISQATAKQFSQEIRIQSDFDSSFNFSLGANYVDFDVLVDYYVFYNLITAQAMVSPFYLPINGEIDITRCALSGFVIPSGPVDAKDPASYCPYIDPNPIESIDGDGHNYFRSKNPYNLTSWAAFGEMYYKISDSAKITLGARYTDDDKTFVPVPSQVLLAPNVIGGGTTPFGYPEDPPIEQGWTEWSGRVGIDYSPDLTLTDQTMIYAFFSRGYKGGGANPPSPGFASLEESIALAEADGVPADQIQAMIQSGLIPGLRLTAVEYGSTFEPEFVNAYEIGAKNTLLDGALTLNATAFYYDYADYQVSQIRDRTAVNENFDATIWGLELETRFSPSRDFQLIANVGYLDTEIADGEKSIDIMNRTQGDPDYTLVKPWVQLPSNCVVPRAVAEEYLQTTTMLQGYWTLCGGTSVQGIDTTPPIDRNPEFGGGTQPYDYRNYPELNGGAGLTADLSGNELPNSPHWTANVGAQYGWDFLEGWRATVRSDLYWQSQSYHRVYNSEPYDKLRGWYNANLSVWIERPEDDLKIELYAKNILDDTPITDAFLNSDDTALTTNVFVLDPRLIGLSIRKGF